MLCLKLPSAVGLVGRAGDEGRVWDAHLPNNWPLRGETMPLNDRIPLRHERAKALANKRVFPPSHYSETIIMVFAL